MPDPKVFTAFLQVYLDTRKANTWNTWTGWFKSWVRDDASIKSADCVLHNKNFYNSTQFDLTKATGWINLFDELGKNAERQYVISATLHAIRTYGIATLLDENNKDETHVAIRTKYLEYIETLRKETHELHQQILKMIDDGSTKEAVKVKTDSYHKNLKRLSNLGDRKAIAMAVHERLFPHLDCPNTQEDIQHLKPIVAFVNTWKENVPWYMHQNWYLMCFDLYYRPYLTETFDKFVQDAIKGNKTEITVAVEAKNGLFASAASFLTFNMTNSAAPPTPSTPPSFKPE